ncbi:MAG: ArsR/SmtB family transcription factor [Nocardioides sp.]|uniref:ArsR/SmtB family transcription factor n=1 Tax=Nocardioides sp. TaxID=35761 RepID=UPI003D6A0040
MTSIETVRAVHHPTRRRIISFLYLHEASQVGAIAGALDQQVGSVSHHLRMLERAAIVERVPELAKDGRTSWWRLAKDTLSFSVEDFDDAGERMLAREAERSSTQHQLSKLSTWLKGQDKAPEEWRKAAFSSDFLAFATPAELAELADEVADTVRKWRHRVKESNDDDHQRRAPVYVFARGFPSKP